MIWTAQQIRAAKDRLMQQAQSMLSMNKERGMGMGERVPVEEAAKILGMSKQGVREHMKRNLFSVPIGEVTKMGNRYQYHIYRSMLNKHIGRENVMQEEEGMG